MATTGSSSDVISQQTAGSKTKSSITLQLHSVRDKDSAPLFSVKRWYDLASESGKVKSAIIDPAHGWDGETEVDEASYTHSDNATLSVGEAQTFSMSQKIQDGWKAVATLSNLTIVADDRSLDGIRTVKLLADVDVQLK